MKENKTKKVTFRLDDKTHLEIYRASKGKMSAWVRELISAELNKNRR